MEKLYIIIIEKLIASIPELKWIDMEKAQMQEERPPVSFPCALVNIKMPRCTDMNDTQQHCHALISISLCFDFTGDRTASVFNTEDREKSFEFLELTRKLYEKLQGWETEDFSPLSRINVNEPMIRKGYKIIEQNFAVEFNDESTEKFFLTDNKGRYIVVNSNS